MTRKHPDIKGPSKLRLCMDLAEVTKQRDELAAALRQASSALADCLNWGDLPIMVESIAESASEAARAALAKVTP